MKQQTFGMCLVALTATVGLAFAAGNNADVNLRKQAAEYYKPLPTVVMPKEGTAKYAEISLGKMLFHDPRLSKSGVISCNTCHNLASYGVDGLATSLGHGFVSGTRNSPTVFNAALHTRQFWDGRAKDVEEQALGPILNPKEMAMPASDDVLTKIGSIPDYVKMFRKAYPKESKPVSYANVGKAIGAFERTLLTPSRFDQFLAGKDAALTVKEKRGLQTFLSIGCAGCHAGAAMGGQVFQKFQIPGLNNEDDQGRFAVTKDPRDKFVFKAYSLRNISRTAPYYHTGSEWDLSKVVEVMAEVQNNKKLTPRQTEEITTFLDCLTGDIPKYALELPILPASGKATPRPGM